MEQPFLNTEKIITILNKWKKHFIYLAIISIVLSTIFSMPFFIPPTFKSTAIVYPINLSSLSEESKTEQMLQVIESMDIKNKMFKAFNLAEHYDIDTTDQYYYTKLIKEFDSNVSFSKTEYAAVEIEVFDINPLKAAQMVDSIIQFYNQKVRAMERSKHAERIKLKKKVLSKMAYEIDSLSAIKRIHQEQYGLFDYGTQSKEATKRYIKILSEGGQNSQSAQSVQNVIGNLMKKGIEDSEVSIKLGSAREVFMNNWRDYGNELVEMEKEISFAQIVTSPFPADKKSSPSRLLIVLLSTIATLLIGFFTVIYLENKNQ